MNNKGLPLILAPLGIFGFSSESGAGTWNNTGTDWNTAASWTGGLPTGGLGQSAVFSSAASTNPNVSSSYTVNGLSFSAAGASGYAISSSNPGVKLTLQSYGSTNVPGNWMISAQNTSGTNTISAPLVLNPWFGGPTRNIGIFNQSAGGTLEISGEISELGGATDLWLVGNTTGGVFRITGTNNSYTGGTGNGAYGGTAIGRGATVQVMSLGSAGANGSLGKGLINIGAANPGLAGTTSATLNYIGTGETSNKVIVLQGAATISTEGASGALVLNGTAIASQAANQTLTLTGSNAGNQIASSITNATTGATALTKTGAGGWALSGSNTISGVTTVSAGTLLIDGTHTGAGAYNVTSGTLGGGGTITTATNAGITLASGSKLSPGNSALSDGSFAAALGTGSLNISAAVGGANSGALLFDLGAIGAAGTDTVSLTSGTLNIGVAALEFADFSFTSLAGFGAGTYVLFDANSAISGSLGAALTGTVGGYDATISLNGSSNDIELNVSAIPEPGTCVLLLAGLATLAILRRRH